MVLKILNVEGHQNFTIGSKERAFLMIKTLSFSTLFLRLIIPFRKVESQIEQLQQDSLRKSCEMTLVSEMVILAQ